MYIDSLLRVASAQAFAAAGVSLSSIDIGVPGGVGTPPQREIGTGEALGFGIAIPPGATATSCQFEVISATDAALTAGILTLSSFTKPGTQDQTSGANYFLPIPMGGPAQRYLGVRVTPGGGSITVSAWLTAHNLFSLLAKTYAKAYVV